MARHSQPLVCCALLVAALGCVKVERESGAAPLARTSLLARGSVTAVEGGTVQVDQEGEFAGVAITFPPGALPEDVEVEIHGRFGDPRLPSVVQTIEFRPAHLELLTEARVTLRYSSVYAATAGQVWGEADIAAYTFRAGPTVDERVRRVLARDPDRDRLIVRTDRLGTFYAMHPPLRSLVSQPIRLIDPATPEGAELVDGRLELSHEGAIPVSIGKGSLAAFRSSPAAANVVLVPGLLMDPLLATTSNGLSPADPRAGLNRDFDNVVIFQYPTGQSLRRSANELYDALLAGAGPGFGCNLVAHGSGGLVARYALEQAHGDPERAGYTPGQPRLDTFVDAVVLLATPHQGAAVADSRFEFLLSAVFETDRRFVQGVLDLMPTGESFLARLNADWQRPDARYFAIAGDADGRHSDGLVDVISAVGVPRTFSRPDAHQVFSGPIYEHGAMLLFADPIGVLDQAREWLGKTQGDAPPVAGGIETPAEPVRGDVEIPLTLSDAESISCLVLALVSVDGADWRVATPVGARSPLVLDASPAPGRPHVFRWDSLTDGVGLNQPAHVVIRFLVNDRFQYGTPGQSGSFTVDNRSGPR